MSATETTPATHLILAEMHLREAVGYLMAVAVESDAEAAGHLKAIGVRLRVELNNVHSLRAAGLVEASAGEPS